MIIIASVVVDILSQTATSGKQCIRCCDINSEVLRHDTYDTIEEFNVDSKAEYTA